MTEATADPITSPDTSPVTPSKRSLRLIGHGLAVAIGLAALVHVVSSVGAMRLLDLLANVGALALVLAALEVLVLALETTAARSLSGATAASSVRGAIVAFAATQVMPGGRIAGEIARIAHTRGEVGTMRAAHASMILQGTHVGAVVVALAAVALAIESDSATLAATLAGVATWNVGITAFFVLAPRSARSLAAVGARLGLDPKTLSPVTHIALDTHVRAAALVLLARGVHVMQAIAAVALVTHRLDARGGLVAEGLQLLSGAVGDAVPGQAGVLEGAFQTFGALVVSDDVAAAVAVAVLLRAVRLALLGPMWLGYLASRSR